MINATIFSHLFPVTKTDSSFDEDGGLLVHQIEKFNHIGIGHPNAAVTCRLANLLFVIRSMDINVAVARVRVVFLHPMQPKNARHYQIFVWRALSGLVDRFATLEDRSLRVIMPNFLSDTEFADRRLPAAFLRTKAKTRRRDREAANRIFALA